LLISAQEMASFSKNGVVSLKKIRDINYYLYKLYVKNKDKFDELLFLKYKICVLNDINKKVSPEYIRLYLKYNYGDKINLSKLQKQDYTIYLQMSKTGGIKNYKKMGFKFEYDRKNKYLHKLWIIADKNGYILPPQKKHYPRMYAALYMAARRRGMKYTEYLEYLGFKIKNRKEYKSAAQIES
jgi:hypothetical protein